MDCKKIVDEFIKSHDLEKMEVGKYMIDDVNFVKISEYNTKEVQVDKFEKHQKFIDGFYMISGEEKVLCSFNAESDLSIYDDVKDVQFFTCNHYTEKVIKKGDLLLLDTDEYHCPAIALNKSCKVKKAIFKIKK